MKKPPFNGKHGRPRVAIRDIQCTACTETFGQTAFEIKIKRTVCPACRKAHAKTWNKSKPLKLRGQRNVLEVVLPKVKKPFWDAKKAEWAMRVRVRKRSAGGPFEQDRVYLGVGKEATPEQVQEVFNATYARMELNGASRITAEAKKKKRKRIKNIVHDKNSWKRGRDKDLGVRMVRIVRTAYRVTLPDPRTIKGKIAVGAFPSREEARKARDEKYKELRNDLIPCAVCGLMPETRVGRLTHFSAKCRNQVQFPQSVRPLLQTKLWNMVFASGDVMNAGRLTPEDLWRMGYLFKGKGGKRFYARDDVSFDFTLAKNYEVKPAVEDEMLFE